MLTKSLHTITAATNVARLLVTINSYSFPQHAAIDLATDALCILEEAMWREELLQSHEVQS